jgi:hypothetical protein
MERMSTEKEGGGGWFLGGIVSLLDLLYEKPSCREV